MTASGSAGLSLRRPTRYPLPTAAYLGHQAAGGFTRRVDFAGSGQSSRVNGAAYTLNPYPGRTRSRPSTGGRHRQQRLRAGGGCGLERRRQPGAAGYPGRRPVSSTASAISCSVSPSPAMPTIQGLFFSADGGAVIRNPSACAAAVCRAAGGSVRWSATAPASSPTSIPRPTSRALFVRRRSGGLPTRRRQPASPMPGLAANVTGTGAVGGLDGHHLEQCRRQRSGPAAT